MLDFQPRQWVKHMSVLLIMARKETTHSRQSVANMLHCGRRKMEGKIYNLDQ